MTLFEQLAGLTTERVNPRTRDIDIVDTPTLVQLLQHEDTTVAHAVASECPAIARGIDAIAAALRGGGRLIYVGAGTSGRLGVVDASECPPTYGTHPAMVQGIIAGGKGAVFASVEGAEDDAAAGAAALNDLPDIDGSTRSVDARDVVCGITASGRTPYVVGALERAHALGACTILVSTNPVDLVRTYAPFVAIAICPVVGPEPIAGSTRMKSGTAQKMVLNRLTTGAMVRLGKTYGNVMVDLQRTNAKLQERANHIVMRIAHVDYHEAANLLDQANGSVKVAIVMALLHCTADEAQATLATAGGTIRAITENVNTTTRIPTNIPMTDPTTRSFADFVERAAARVEAADPADPMTPYRPLNLSRMKRLQTTYEPSHAMRTAMESLHAPRTWLVITEDWCGDSAQTLPILAAIAQLNPQVDFVIVDRDTNPDIMDRYLTNGSRSIPILVARDAKGNDLWTWGPRPDAMLALIEEWKAAGRPKEDWYTELHTWYAHDKGTSTEADIIARMATEHPSA